MDDVASNEWYQAWLREASMTNASCGCGGRIVSVFYSRHRTGYVYRDGELISEMVLPDSTVVTCEAGHKNLPPDLPSVLVWTT